MTLNVIHSKVRRPEVTGSSSQEDESTERHLGDLTSAFSTLFIEGSTEIKNIELSIFLERILSTFNCLLEKLELSVTLPILLTHPSLLHILTKEEMNEITETFFEFSTEESCHSNIDYSIINTDNENSKELTNPFFLEENENLPISMKILIDTSSIQFFQIPYEKINKVLEILNSYSEIREIIKLEKKRISHQLALFLEHMEFIVEHVIRKIQITPEEAREKEVYYRKIWHANEKAHVDIKDLAALIDVQNLNFKKILDTLIRQWEEKKDAIKNVEQKFEADIKLKSEGRQLKANKISGANRISLNQNLKEAKNNLECLSKKNTLIEKNITYQRYKVEAQLASVIRKYDSEIGEKQKEIDELIAEYNSIDSEKLELEESMETQFKIHNALIKEREEAVLNTFREKLEKLMLKRAAKVLQRWWRKIYWRFKTKSKKGKSDKKKKKKIFSK